MHGSPRHSAEDDLASTRSYGTADDDDVDVEKGEGGVDIGSRFFPTSFRPPPPVVRGHRRGARSPSPPRRAEEGGNNNAADPAGSAVLLPDERTHALLVKWKLDCRGKERAHEHSRSHYKTRGDAVSAAAIALSGTSGVANLATAHVGGGGTRAAINIVFGLLGIASSVLMNMYRQLNFGEMEKAHGFFSTEYGKAAEDINMQLTLNNTTQRMFTSVNEFVKHCQRRIESLKDREPAVLPEAAAKAFCEQVKSTSTQTSG